VIDGGLLQVATQINELGIKVYIWWQRNQSYFIWIWVVYLWKNNLLAFNNIMQFTSSPTHIEIWEGWIVGCEDFAFNISISIVCIPVTYKK
jgi:hypothetical protein